MPYSVLIIYYFSTKRTEVCLIISPWESRLFPTLIWILMAFILAFLCIVVVIVYNYVYCLGFAYFSLHQLIEAYYHGKTRFGILRLRFICCIWASHTSQSPLPANCRDCIKQSMRWFPVLGLYDHRRPLIPAFSKFL